MIDTTNSSRYYDSVFSTYLDEINRIPLLTPEQEVMYATRARKGDKRARDKMIESNLRFVVDVAKKYQNQGLSLNDLVNEGNIGLMTAVDKFEPERGYRFISYAVWWIRQSIVKAINDKGRTVRLPMNRSNELLQINKAKRTLAKEGLAPTSDLIAVETGLKEKTVKGLMDISRTPVSLDAPVFTSKGSDSEVGDFVEDEGLAPEDEVMISAMKENIDSQLETLSEREREVIEMRFGLHGVKPMSLKEIGNIYGLTKERIRQIEKQALERLRVPARSRYLESFAS